MKYEEARTKPRVFQQLTGLKIEEFNKLKGAFQKASEEEEPRESPAGRKAVLRTYEDKLFFILFYLRHYPTQEVLGVLVRYQPRASEPVDSSLDSACQEGLGR